MCTATNAELIRDVVTSRVNNNEMFTAFEVSLAVQELARDRGEAVERHRDMKTEIHNQLEDYLNNGLYQRLLRDVGAPSPAFVYFPAGGDPTKYVPLERRDKAAPNPNIVATVVAISAPAPALSGPTSGTPLTVGRLPDARGTLCVPSNLLRDAGFAPKEAAYVYGVTQDSGRRVLVVTKQVSGGNVPLTTYTVDENVNVRVTAHTLAAAGLSAQTFDFERNDHEVVVFGT